ALERLRLDVERLEEDGIARHSVHVLRACQPLGLEDAGELGEGAALAEEHGVLPDAAALEEAEHGQGVRSLRNLVLARLEAARGAASEGEEHEAQRAPDDACLVEPARDVGEPLMRRNLYQPG